jgi:hypothetical protein
MCTEQLPPGDFPIAVKYIILYHITRQNPRRLIFRFTNVRTQSHLYVVYLMTASSTDFTAAKIWGGSVNNELKRPWKKASPTFLIASVAIING